MGQTAKGYPFPDTTDPADVPLDIEALANVNDARPGVSALTTVQRDALTGADLWDGRVIWNRTTTQLEQFISAGPAWAPAATTLAVLLASLPQVQLWQNETDLAGNTGDYWATIDAGNAPVVTLPAGWNSMDVMYDGWVAFRFNKEPTTRSWSQIALRLSGSAGITSPLEELHLRGINDTVETRYEHFPIMHFEAGVTEDFSPSFGATAVSTNGSVADPAVVDRLLRVTKIRRS